MSIISNSKSKKYKKSGRNVKLSRRRGFLVASNGKKISMKQTRALIDKFP